MFLRIDLANKASDFELVPLCTTMVVTLVQKMEAVHQTDSGFNVS